MEDFVTFEQAKALKELGFDWKCNHYYFMDWGELISYNPADIFDQLYVDFNNSSYWNNGESYTFSAPTLAQAQKWLREVKNIIVLATCSIDYEQGHEWYWFVDKDIHIGFPEQFYDTYEQALSAGVDKALDFLKEDNNEKDSRNTQ